jgi:hypothetical protein
VNKWYYIGSALVGLGYVLAYHAGRQDMQAEIKKAERKRWLEAAIDPDMQDDLVPGPDCNEKERKAFRHIPSEHPEAEK